MAENMQDITIYVLDGCPYCKKVLDVLDDMELPYETIGVPSSHEKRDKVEEVSGQTAVPVITDPNNDVEGMNESDDIVEYLEENYEYPEGKEKGDGDDGFLGGLM